MNGIRLAVLFSCIPNKLGYCGPKNANTLFYDYLKNNKNDKKIKNILVMFEALYPYLKIIAKEHKKDVFDYKVIEAYWLGNELADLSKKSAISLIDMLNKRGLISSISKNLVGKLKKLDREEIPLTHLFHVLFVGVGSVTGSVPTIIENIDNCRISRGVICEINDSYLVVDHNRLKKEGNKYFINKDAEKIKVNYDKNLFDNLKVGDAVAVHWRSAVKKLNSKELSSLKKYTQKTIELISRL